MSNTVLQAISKLTDSELQATQTLFKLLQQESQALKNRQHGQLPQIVEQKSQALRTIENCAKKREGLLTAQGKNFSSEAWIELLGRLGDDSLIERWQQTVSNFEEGQRLNDINGKIIQRSQKALGNLLNMLRGNTGSPGLYDQAGSTQSRSGGTTLVSA